ncbi:hypothetical protein GCM10009765_66400 [Fodinicola feengrottensis]|uniref:Uncharacterized protein n=1 Tax=Fodinicola feengrottensis TaxID=435914 RepID=A0ABP4UL54_9ACTN
MVLSTIGGVIALALAGVLFYLKIFKKTTAALTLVGGTAITGGIGGHILTSAVSWTSTMVGHVTATVVGIAVPFVLSLVLTVIYIHDMWPKKGAKTRTAGIGLVLPILAQGIPGSVGATLTGAIAMIAGLLSGFIGSIF